MADPSVSTCTDQLRRDSAEGTCIIKDRITNWIVIECKSIERIISTTIGPVDQDTDLDIFFN